MTDPAVLAPGAGENLWFLDTLMQVKVAAAASDGAMAVFEQLAPPGSATPMHRHDATDEHFYVLSGEVTFHGPSGAQRCVAATFVSVSRGTPHAFRVADTGEARLLVISAPATFEGFVRAVSRPTADATLPPPAPPPTPADMERLVKVGSQHDTIVLGPPPPAS